MGAKLAPKPPFGLGHVLSHAPGVGPQRRLYRLMRQDTPLCRLRRHLPRKGGEWRAASSRTFLKSSPEPVAPNPRLAMLSAPAVLIVSARHFRWRLAANVGDSHSPPLRGRCPAGQWEVPKMSCAALTFSPPRSSRAHRSQGPCHPSAECLAPAIGRGCGLPRRSFCHG